MDIEYQSKLAENDKEYKLGLIPISNMININPEEPPSIYNPPQFQERVIINTLQKYNVLKDMNICLKCGNIMGLVTHKPSKDNII